MALGTPSWLNLDFVERILRNSENDNSIRVIDIFSKAATSKGDNYTSDMIRVFAEFSRGKEDRKEKKSIILKISPTDGAKKQMIEEVGFFKNEMIMMSNTLKKMNEFLGKNDRLNAKLLYFQGGDPTILALEDLASLGFRMADRQAGLDLTHSLMALRRLAKFHASSVALCEKEPEQKEMYGRGIFCKEYPSNLLSFFKMELLNLSEAAAKWPELHPKYAEKLKRFADVVCERGNKASERKETSFNVINHGDFWVNNMLFRYNDEGKPTDHIFVDFQLCLYTSPVIDLLYFFNTSLNEEVLKNHKEQLLQEYLCTLSSTMKRIDCKTPAPTIEELKREMRDRATYGMIASFTILPFMLVDKSLAPDINDMLQHDGNFKNPALNTDAYRRVITKRILEFDEMGLLDN